MRTLYRGGSVLQPRRPVRHRAGHRRRTVAWVGSDEAAGAHADAVDDVVELDGALVTPAFVDAHVHVTETGLALRRVDVRDGALASARSSAPSSAPRAPAAAGRCSAHGWDERDLAEGRPPTRAELDRASAGGVVYLARVDSHSAVVSSALAAAAGARDHAGWTEDGRVERDAHHAVRAADPGGAVALRPGGRPADRATGGGAAGIGRVHEASAPHIAPEADLRALVALAGVDHPTEAEPLPEVVPYRGQLVADEAQARAVVERLGVPLGGPGRRPQRRRGGRLAHGLVPRAVRRRPRHQRPHLPLRRADP